MKLLATAQPATVDFSFIAEIGGESIAVAVQVVGTSLDNEDGTLKLQTGNDGVNFSDVVNPGTSDVLEVTAVNGSNVLCCDGFLMGQFVKIVYTKGTDTTGTFSVNYSSKNV